MREPKINSSQSQGTGGIQLPGLNQQTLDFHTALIATGSLPETDGSGRCFLFSDDEHPGDFLQLCSANLRTELFIAAIDFYTHSGRTQLLSDTVRVLHELFRQRQDRCLHRREPERERSREVLDEDGDETLERSVDR